ncbi:transglycosylase SLT domain-containing protein [Candidatus Micrarchaeota archaeon]|nr:transglycosylase SLT domain-containing protein [Candidatus Micrarchaeota archaeon]
MKKGVIIRIPKPGEGFRKFRNKVASVALAALIGLGVGTAGKHYLVDERIAREQQTIFAPARAAKQPEFVHLEPSVTQVENAIQSILKNPDYNRVALERTAWFHDLIQKHAADNNVDAGLLYALVAQESRGAVNAESHAGAGGLAQFMPETGENYELYPLKQLVSVSKGNIFNYKTVGDARLDPDKALGAAAKHLSDLIGYYAQRGYLEEKQRESEYNAKGPDAYAAFYALAAYNAGYNRVDRAIAETVSKGGLATWPEVSKRLREETRQYVPLILAKKIILENIGHFGSEHGLGFSNDAFGAYTQLLGLTEAKKLERTSIKTFARANGFDEEHLQLLNPHLKTNVWLKEAELRVPKKEEIRNFRSKFENFKNLCWNNFTYRGKKQEQTRVQATCEHVTREKIKKSLTSLAPKLPPHLTKLFPLKKIPRSRRA